MFIDVRTFVVQSLKIGNIGLLFAVLLYSYASSSGSSLRVASMCQYKQFLALVALSPFGIENQMVISAELLTTPFVRTRA